MSAILAVVHLDGRPVDGDLARRLTEVMQPNGPDRRDVWRDEQAALGCASFFTVPEQRGEPNPLFDDRAVVALDGRIDNGPQLARELRAAGVQVPEGAGDAGMVLAAYHCWGDDAPAHLLGEWAIVIWDRERRRLLAARDHLAVRSLYWWTNGRTLVACSTFAPILAHPEVSAEPNEGVIAEWLAGAPSTLDETLWKWIHALPGGRRLVAEQRTSPRVTRYWDPARLLDSPAFSADEASEAMVATVEEATRCRLRVIGTPEVELSGGWDSSTVAAVAHQLHEHGEVGPFALSSAVYPGQPFDETPYIEAMERHLGARSDQREQRLTPVHEVASAMSRLRHPWPRDASRRLAVTPDTRVILSGDGGNETLGGMWRSAASLGLTPFILGRDAPGRALRTFAHAVLRPRLRPYLPWRLRVARQAPVSSWLPADFVARTDLRSRLAAAEVRPQRGSTRQRSLLAWADDWGTHNRGLTTELDRGTYAELRHPLLDVRLFEAALRTPARISGTPEVEARRLHARAFGDRLPGLVTARTWGAEFSELRHMEALELRGRVAGCPRAVSAGFVTREGVAEAERALARGGVPWAASLLYAVELWMTATEPT